MLGKAREPHALFRSKRIAGLADLALSLAIVALCVAVVATLAALSEGF